MADKWAALIAWSQRHDDRQISDAARRWADAESDLTSMPENAGEWSASMEMAFDAGRQWQRMEPDDG